MATNKDPINVCVTGAAGQIAYSLLYGLCKGDVFGHNQPIVLHLLDIPHMIETLHGVAMELEDCSFPVLAGVRPSSDPEEAFRDCDVAVLVGAMPRKEGMERKDLLAANVKIFKAQGAALDKVAKKTVKVLVVGNPANTNAMIAAHYAPSIPKTQFTCLTQLDQNRAVAQVALKLQVNPDTVKNVIIWGNHSSTQYPDVTHAHVNTAHGPVSVAKLVGDDAYLRGAFIKTVQTRGAAVIKARKLSSAMSAAKAICDHLHVWFFGTAPGEVTSMGVVSDGSYDIAPGVVYSFPVTITQGHISIHHGLPIDEFSKTKMAETLAELIEEKEQALAECA